VLPAEYDALSKAIIKLISAVETCTDVNTAVVDTVDESLLLIKFAESDATREDVRDTKEGNNAVELPAVDRFAWSNKADSDNCKLLAAPKVGMFVGCREGWFDGCPEGFPLGWTVGCRVGVPCGWQVGCEVGT
jgi:hypothetical protein